MKVPARSVKRARRRGQKEREKKRQEHRLDSGVQPDNRQREREKQLVYSQKHPVNQMIIK